MTDFQVAPVYAGAARWMDPGVVNVSSVKISPLQLQLLRFIDQRQRDTGTTPSYVEMRDHLYPTTKTTVTYQMRQLVAKGLIRRVPGTHRGITLNVRLR